MQQQRTQKNARNKNSHAPTLPGFLLSCKAGVFVRNDLMKSQPKLPGSILFILLLCSEHGVQMALHGCLVSVLCRMKYRSPPRPRDRAIARPHSSPRCPRQKKGRRRQLGEQGLSKGSLSGVANKHYPSLGYEVSGIALDSGVQTRGCEFHLCFFHVILVWGEWVGG